MKITKYSKTSANGHLSRGKCPLNISHFVNILNIFREVRAVGSSFLLVGNF
jgi:hypothetical protein